MTTPPLRDKVPLVVDLGLRPPQPGDWLCDQLFGPYIPEGRDTFLALVPNRFKEPMK